MKVNVNEILKNGVTLNVTEPREWLLSYFSESDEVTQFLKQDISLNIHFEMVKEAIRIQGTIETILSPTCCLCAETYSLPFTYTFEHMLFKFNAADALDDSVDYYEGYEIDMLPIIGEQFALGLPDQFICQETCHGLCHTCGINKNYSSCECADNTNDDHRTIGEINHASS